MQNRKNQLCHVHASTRNHSLLQPVLVFKRHRSLFECAGLQIDGALATFLPVSLATSASSLEHRAKATGLKVCETSRSSCLILKTWMLTNLTSLTFEAHFLVVMGWQLYQMQPKSNHASYVQNVLGITQFVRVFWFSYNC